VSVFAGNLGVECLKIGTVLEFVVQQSEQIGEGEDCFHFIEEGSETSFLIGIGSGSGTFDEIVDPGENVVNWKTSVVEILDEVLDGGFFTDGVDEFCPFRALEIENNSGEGTVSFKMVIDNSLDVIKREEVNEILQIVDQTSGRNFLVGQPRVVLGGTNAEADDRKKNNEINQNLII
jgi:hypothetical protein